MNHWRCGRPEDAHTDWCSDGTPGDCDHCGGNPCRWWCLGEDADYGSGTGPGVWRFGHGAIAQRAREMAGV